MQGPPSLRDASLSDIVRRAMRLYGDTIAPAVPIALVMNLPLLLIGALPMEPDQAGPGALSMTLILVLVCSGIAVSAVTRILLGAAAGTPVPLGGLLRLTFRRSLVTVTLIFTATSFLSNLGLLALVLPGLALGGLFAAAIPAALVERRASLSAIARSVALMRRDLFKAMAAFSFGVLASELLPLGLMLGLQSVAGPSPFSPLLAVTINGITLPVALAVGVSLYCSARAEEGAAPDALQAELARAATGEEAPPGA